MYRIFLTNNPLCTSLLLIVYVTTIITQSTTELESDIIEVGLEKNFILGGLFPVHTKGLKKITPCGTLLKEKGIQRLEAMLYAIDQINGDPDYWDISLGAMIMDTCSSGSHALEQSLKFLKIGECENGSSSQRRVTAVVGAANSPVSESVANILRLFKITQVSYASSSEELDNLDKYPYFYRVVPSDRFQVNAILDILEEFEWNVVLTVAAMGEYGERAVEKLKNQVSNSTKIDVCFAYGELLPRSPLDRDYEDAINRLLIYGNAKAVVVFLNEEKLSKLLSAAKKLGSHFQWIGSDSWGIKPQPVSHHHISADGAITILSQRYDIEGFDKYFRSLTPNLNTRNPWFTQFWESQFNCFLPSAGRTASAGHMIAKCTGNENLTAVYKQEGLVAKVVDSVYLIAHALKGLCAADPARCLKWDSKLHGELLRNSIINVTFNSSQGHDMVVRFDSERNVPANYTIYQFRKLDKTAGTYDYVPIGTWNRHSRLKIHTHPVWSEKGAQLRSMPTCSESCKPGEERIEGRERRCCWECQPCGLEYYIPHVNAHCTPCPTGQLPTENRTSCTPIQPEYMGSDWGSPWTLVPALFSCLGIIGTILALVVFILYRETPVIKAAGRELCYVMLIGILCCYLFTFVVATKPTEISCGILRVGLGFGLSVCYASIFTKTNRISRIFNRRLSSVKRPAYISPASQLVICLSLVLIQLTLTIMWLIIKPPSVENHMRTTPRAYILTCGIDDTSVQLGLVFNMILVLMCTVYAFKTRNMPANFNEAKYINFTMYSTCIVWLAFVTIYSSTWQNFVVQSTVLCMSVSLSGTVVLLCIFFPKLYLVLLQPHKNVRNPNTTSNSTSAMDSLAPVRFLRTDMGTSNVSPGSTSNASHCNQGANLRH